ncbi:MAG: methylenetetrahydrofolate reductase [NAD(P)H] [Prevotellaceae bacterium]|jgi:methylenetetrahydrofolate reductase (NADPH)|nr:methylenetetrahydrofolate reductase [NAD(P)H] [Prevotellaceae bacterium]
MKISGIFEQTAHTFSFEFFPPKDEISAVDFGVNVGRLMKLSPSFVSVTYGAGGSNRERTFALVNYLQNKTGMNVMAHYTCVGASKTEIIADISYLKSINVNNLMLLRGDPPKGTTDFVPHNDGFAHASELIEAVCSEFRNTFTVGAACYPEKHPEAKTQEEDIARLKEKTDAGADFLITQFFFDNDLYFNFINEVRNAGIRCRIIPGIIPLTSYSQIDRFVKLSGAKIPSVLADKIAASKDNPKRLVQTGIDYTIEQCKNLILGGAPGVHFYTLNKSGATVEIYETVRKYVVNETV